MGLEFSATAQKKVFVANKNQLIPYLHFYVTEGLR
jgi:hypothetical protein